MEAKHRVLVIAYHYPPLAGAGVLKILRTTRYLPQFGWEPLVLTVKNPEPYHRAPNPIPDGVQVFRSWRIPGGNLLARVLRRLKLDERWLMLPDQYVFWIPATFIYGLYLILVRKVELIYVTGPPYSALMVGALLKIFTGKPLVTDVRDPWSFNAARHGYPTGLHCFIDRVYEKWVLGKADYITCIYRITRDGYQQRYPWTESKSVVFYDTVDLADLPENVKTTAIFTLTYLGTFYPPFHSLKATLSGIKLLLENGDIDPAKFRFNYVGPLDKTFEQLVTTYGLESIIQRTGYLPVKAAQAEASRSQVLLLLLEFATINTKLFDYLATGNSILAVVPEFAELSDLLERYATAYFKETGNDHFKIAQALKQWYNDYYHGEMVLNLVKQQAFRAELNIETETKELTQIFTNIVSKKVKDV